MGIAQCFMANQWTVAKKCSMEAQENGLMPKDVKNIHPKSQGETFLAEKPTPTTPPPAT